MMNMQDLKTELFRRIEWQDVPDDVTSDDLIYFLADAIEYLYVMTGRAAQYTSDLWVMGESDDGNRIHVTFKNDLPPDERWYVILTAQIEFYRKVQSDVDDMVSYTTDAMSVTHGDKPFANLQQKIENLERERLQIWYKMSRFHMA